MFIEKLELKNFKRFTDLTIDLTNLENNPKLVLLIGTNGSGKSCVFDAFEAVSGHIKDSMKNIFSNKEFEIEYYKKAQEKNFEIALYYKNQLIVKRDENGIPNDPKNIFRFYGRSSLRQVPKLTRTGLGQENFNIENDSDRPKYYIERDFRFENDLEKMTEQVVSKVFDNPIDSKSLINKYISPINEAFDNIFNHNYTNKLKLIRITPPVDRKTGKIIFKKGQVNVSYDFLSSGEKEIFNILFNLLVRKELYQDTIYFFDELDLHLNTQLQYNLLKEITENWIPENCQIWTASHSLGFIKYAQEYQKGIVVDFDDLNFDVPQTIYAEPKENLDIYEVAVPKELLLNIFNDFKLIFCENQNDEYYNLFGFNKTIFVGTKDSRSVFINIKHNKKYFGLRDRDFLTNGEINRLKEKYKNYKILEYYCFENYLYHPDNIEELNLDGFDKTNYKKEITKQKNEVYDYIISDFKSARKSYEDFKTNELKADGDEENTIIKDLKSNNFEKFYKYFSMKKFNRRTLEKYNLTKQKLVKTKWFKSQIENIIK